MCALSRRYRNKLGMTLLHVSGSVLIALTLWYMKGTWKWFIYEGSSALGMFCILNFWTELPCRGCFLSHLLQNFLDRSADIRGGTHAASNGWVHFLKQTLLLVHAEHRHELHLLTLHQTMKITKLRQGPDGLQQIVRRAVVKQQCCGGESLHNCSPAIRA